MTTEQKFQALADIDSDICLRLDLFGKWYVSAKMEICGNGICKSIGEHAAEPYDAIDSYWKAIETMKRNERLQVGVRGPSYQWTGFMWKAVEHEEAA